MRLIAPVFLVLALALTGCATVNRVDAAADIHQFLTSVRDNDRPKFNAYVDRDALKLQLESRLIREARNSSMPRELKVLGAVLAAPVADAAGSALIRPSVFRAVAVSLGYSPDKPLPKTLSIAAALRPAGDDLVCASKGKDAPCLLTFRREGDVWRLVSFDAAMDELKL